MRRARPTLHPWASPGATRQKARLTNRSIAGMTDGDCARNIGASAAYRDGKGAEWRCRARGGGYSHRLVRLWRKASSPATQGGRGRKHAKREDCLPFFRAGSARLSSSTKRIRRRVATKCRDEVDWASGRQETLGRYTLSPPFVAYPSSTNFVDSDRLSSTRHQECDPP
jgi:hypothetical protein